MKDHYHLKGEGKLDHGFSEDKLEFMKSWMREVVDAIGMNILVDPISIWCNTLGNEGMTGFCCIDTSHLAWHQWSGNEEILPFIKFDIYSCKYFDINVIFPYLRKIGIYKVDFTLEDRSDDSCPIVLDQKKGLYL